MRILIAITLGVVVVFLITTYSALVQGINPANNTEVLTKGITRVELERYEIPGTDQEMRMYLVVYPPGVSAPVHHHPAVGFNYILEGTAESAYGRDQPQTYHAKQSFQDKAITPHMIFRNPDKSKPLKFLIFSKLKKGQPFTVVP